MAGRVQLAAKGLQDEFLTGNPTTSSFRVILKKHTPYLTNSLEVPFKDTGTAFGTSQICDISGAGDLVRSVTLRITLPALASVAGTGLVYPDPIQSPRFWYLDARFFPFASYFGRNLKTYFSQLDTNWLPTVVSLGPESFQFSNSSGPAWIGFTDLSHALFWGFKNYQQVQQVQGLGQVYLWAFTGASELTYYASGWSLANSNSFETYPASSALELIQTVELYIGGQLIETIPNQYLQIINDLDVPNEQQASLSNLYQVPVISTSDADCYIKVPFSFNALPVCALQNQTVEILVNIAPFSAVQQPALGNFAVTTSQLNWPLIDLFAATGTGPYTLDGYTVNSSNDSSSRAKFAFGDSFWQTSQNYTAGGQYVGSVTTASYAGEWISITMPNPIVPSSMYISPSVVVQGTLYPVPMTGVLLGWTGSSWTLLANVVNGTTPIATSQSFATFRLVVLTSTYWAIVANWSITGTGPPTGAVFCQGSDYVLGPFANALSSFKNFPNSDFTANASSNASSASNIFINTHGWYSTGSNYSGSYTGTANLGGYSGEWVTVQLPSVVYLSVYVLAYERTYNSPTHWVLLGSNTGSSWNLIDNCTYVVDPGNNLISRSVSGAYSWFAVVVLASTASYACIGTLQFSGHVEQPSSAVQQYTNGSVVGSYQVPGGTIIGTDNSNVYCVGGSNIWQGSQMYDLSVSQIPTVTAMTLLGAKLWVFSDRTVQVSDTAAWNPTGYPFPGAYAVSEWQSFVIAAVPTGIAIMSSPSSYQMYQTPWGPPLFLSQNYYVTANALVEFAETWNYVGPVSNPTAMAVNGSNVYVFSGSSYTIFSGLSVTVGTLACNVTCATTVLSNVYVAGPNGVYAFSGTQLSSAPTNYLTFTYNLPNYYVVAGNTSSTVTAFCVTGSSGFTCTVSSGPKVFADVAILYSGGLFIIAPSPVSIPTVTFTESNWSQCFFDGQYVYTFASNVYVYDTFGSFSDSGSHMRFPFSANVQSASFDGQFVTTFSSGLIGSVNPTNFNITYYTSTLQGNLTASTNSLVASDAGIIYTTTGRSQSITSLSLQPSIGSYTDGAYVYAFASNLVANGYVQYSPLSGSTIVTSPFSDCPGVFTKIMSLNGLVYIIGPTSLVIYNPSVRGVYAIQAPQAGFSNAAVFVGSLLYLFPLLSYSTRTVTVVDTSELTNIRTSYIAPPSTSDTYTTACYDGTNIYLSNGIAVYTVNPNGDYFAQASVWKPFPKNFGYLARNYSGNIYSVTSGDIYVGLDVYPMTFNSVPLMSRQDIYFLDGSNLYAGLSTSSTSLPVSGKSPVDMNATSSNVWVSWSDGTLGRLDTTAPSPLYYSASAYLPSGTINATTYFNGNVFALVNGSNLVDIGAQSTTHLTGSFADLAVFQSNLYVLPSDIGLGNVYCNGTYFSHGFSYGGYGGKLVTTAGIYMYTHGAPFSRTELVTFGSVVATNGFAEENSALYIYGSNVWAVPSSGNTLTCYYEASNNFANADVLFTQTVSGALAAYKDWFVTSTGYSNVTVTFAQTGLIPMFAGPWLCKNDGTLFVNVDTATNVSSTSFGTFDKAFLSGNVYLANTATGALQIFNGTSSSSATTVPGAVAIAESEYGTFVSNGTVVNVIGRGTVAVATGTAVASSLTADGSVIFAGTSFWLVTPGISNVYSAPNQFSCVFVYGGYSYFAPSNGTWLAQVSASTTVNSLVVKYYQPKAGGSPVPAAPVSIGLDNSGKIQFAFAGLYINYYTYDPNLPFDVSNSWTSGTTQTLYAFTFSAVGSTACYFYPGRGVLPITALFVSPYSYFTCPVNLSSPVSTLAGNTLWIYSQSNLVTFTTDTRVFTVTNWPYGGVEFATTINSNVVAIEMSNVTVNGSRYPFVNTFPITGTCFDGRFLNILTHGSNIWTFDTTNWAWGPIKGPSFTIMQNAGTQIYTGSNVLSFSPRPYTESSWAVPLTGLIGTYAVEGSNLVNFTTGSVLTSGLSPLVDSLFNNNNLVMLGSQLYIFNLSTGSSTSVPVPKSFELATDGINYYTSGSVGVTKIYPDYTVATTNVFSNATYLYTQSGSVVVGNLTSYVSFSQFASVSGLYNMILPYTFTNMGATGPAGPTSITYGASTPGYGTANVLVLTAGIQYWTVPFTGTYTITAAGASSVGLGTIVSNSFSLTQGQVVSILVGQQSGTLGAGGTFVALGNTPLIVAGGGGTVSNAIFGIGTQGNSGAGFSTDGPSTNSFLHGGQGGGGFGGGGITTTGGLYSFGSFTFTGTTGPTGPSLSQMRSTVPSAWQSYVNSGTFSAGTWSLNSSGGIWLWTVPVTGTYSFTVAGAGMTNPYSVNSVQTSYGFVLTDSVSLTQGHQIAMLVGQAGSLSGGVSGGCGGSFVYNLTTSTLLFVAGGGGGIGYETSGIANLTVNGVAGTTAQNGGGWNDDGPGRGAGTGGTNGAGGTPAGNFAYVWGDCGAGYSGNGSSGRYGGSGPSAFLNGGFGSTASGVAGGFGGGGCGGGYGGDGGGAGGYSGGGAGGSDGQGCGGGGGASFSINGNPQGSATNSGQGYITVSVTVPCGGGGYYGGDAGVGGSSFGGTGSTYNTGPGYVIVAATQSGSTVYGVQSVGVPHLVPGVQASIVTDDVYFFGTSNVVQTLTKTIPIGTSSDVFSVYQDGSTLYGVPATTGNVVVVTNGTASSFSVPGSFSSLVMLNGVQYYLSNTATSAVLDPYSINTASWSETFFFPDVPVSLFSYGNQTVFATSKNVFEVQRGSTLFLTPSYTGEFTACYYDGRYIKIFGPTVTVQDTEPPVDPTNLFVSTIVDTVLLGPQERQWYLQSQLDYVVTQIQTTTGLSNGFYRLYLTGPTTELFMSNVSSAELFLNGYSKSRMDSEYLQVLVPYWTHARTPTTGVSVLPLAPYVNMSRIREQVLYLETTGPATVFAKTLNVLRIKEGLGGLVFVGRSR